MILRPAIKQVAIEQSVRRRIVRGFWKPAQQIATRHELMAEFGVSMITVQRAIDALANEGFVVARGRAGTRVSERPPHLAHYALVFYSHPTEPHSWGRFWQVMASEALAIERDGDRKMLCFYDVNGHSDSEDYQRLVRDVRNERLAGLIFASNPQYLDGTPLMEHAGMPRVAISAPRPGLSIATVEVHGFGVIARAVQHLASRGRRKIALLAKSGVSTNTEYVNVYLAALKRHRLAPPPYWRQFVDIADHEAIVNATHMLLQRKQDPCPDALIVGDDSLLDAATAGLINAGVRIPRDVEVVAHCNFPLTAGNIVPVTRVGFDIRRVLNACIESIDLQRRGKTPPKAVTIPAQFESEITNRSSELKPPTH